jgi:hypothetical protein
MPIYFGWFLLQQMTLAAMYSWWLAPLVSKRVRSEILAPVFLGVAEDEARRIASNISKLAAADNPEFDAIPH